MPNIFSDGELSLIRVTDLKDDADVRSMYKTAFPKIEQKPYRLIKLYSRLRTEDFFAICKGETPLAHAFLLVRKECVLLYYFAVSETLRGGGIGSESLALLKKYYSRPMLVIMEPVDPAAEDYALRSRRMAFYERSGFANTGLSVSDWSGTFSILSTMGKPDKKLLYRMLKGFGPFDRHLSVSECE